MHIPIDARKVDKTDRDRVLSFHVKAQAEGINNFISSAAGGGFIIYHNIYDDASMWVARPKLANNNIAMEQPVIDAVEDPLRKRALAKRKHT